MSGSLPADGGDNDGGVGRGIPRAQSVSSIMEITAANALQLNANEFACDFVLDRKYRPVTTCILGQKTGHPLAKMLLLYIYFQSQPLMTFFFALFFKVFSFIVNPTSR